MLTNDSRSGGLNRQEPIPGYKILDLLGRGGFGEVWRAIAPGGIAKAIKIIHGDGDPSRVATEMRALARIKDVRHPLLLSIERIEVTDGSLIMVTELADSSLKDHFLNLRETGSVGIPQSELLQYIADAGEALDYLYEKYSLQHLDVKPENILIISGRGKVGDFGLVKSLYERSASMIGGLTPTYAPPELFEGKPNRHSDQYGLAIVYMHMLTGVLPFSGTNMAQIATQHLRGIPDLSALPKRQRTVIARALSKEPSQRFDSCMAMVSALRESIREVEQVAPSPAPLSHSHRSPVEQCVRAPLRSAEGVSSQSQVPLKTGNARNSAHGDTDRHTRADSLTATRTPLGPHSESDRPTVLVGIGGAGVEVLVKVIARLRDRFGTVDNWPAVEMLALDTNTKFVSSQFHEAELARVQVVPIPLKTAEDYGPRAGEFLKWLDRRWFYNIPRDPTSAGYRPFGRLALVTHAKAVREAISGVMTRACNHHVENTGAAPRVVLVGSISGGTGGGAIIDLAYTLRAELKSRGMPDEQVHGLLLHATARSNADRDRARANAYATLTELHHYSRAGAHFPGEPLLGVPPFHGDNVTFGQTHLLHLGDGLGQAEWDLAAEQVAELLYCTNFTPARRVLDEQQATESLRATPANCPTTIQSYGVLSLGSGNSRMVAQAALLAQNDIIRMWREGTANPQASSVRHTGPTAIMHACAWQNSAGMAQIDQAVTEQLARCKLDGAELLKDASAVLELEVGGNADHFAENIIDEALESTKLRTDEHARIGDVIEIIDRLLLCVSEVDLDDSSANPLFPQVVSRLCVRTHGRVEGLLDWIKKLVDSHELRVDGARQSAAGARLLLQAAYEKLQGQAAQLHESAIAQSLELRSPDAQQPERSRFSGWTFRKPTVEDRLRVILKPYAQNRLKEFVLRVVVKRIRIVDAEVSQLLDQVLRLARDLAMLVEQTRETKTSAEEADEESFRGSATLLAGYRQKLHQLLRLKRQNIVHKIDAVIQQDVFGANGGLSALLEPEAEVRKLLLKPLTEAARQAVLESIREISCQLIGGTSVPENGPALDLAALISTSFPAQSAIAQSGFVSQVLVIPDEVDPTSLRQRLGSALPNLTVVQGRKCDVTLCALRHPLPLARVATDLISGIDIYKDLASRLHSRVDIAWAPFTDADAADLVPACEPSPEEFSSHTAVLPARVQVR